MKCRNCQAEIDINDRYCPYCGSENKDNQPIDISPNDVEIIDQNVSENLSRIDANNYSGKRYLIAILIYHAIIYIGASIISAIVTIGLMMSGIKLTEGDQINERAVMLADIWTQILTYLALVAVSVAILIDDLKKDTLRIRQDIKQILIWALIGLGVMYGANIILNTFYSIINLEGDSANQEAITDMLIAAPLYLKIIYSAVIVVAAPLVEELIFRKAFFGFLKTKKLKPTMCIIISGIVFGLLHVFGAILGYLIQGKFGLIGPEFLFGLTYIAMGTIFSFVYYQANENIYSSLILHVVNNLISIFVVFFL